jgi:predicted acetyltransferase
MMNQPINSQPAVEVTPATLEQKPILANLLELYTHDFCDFLELELQPDGRFGYALLDLYWKDPARRPFLVMVDEKLAGFVLLRCIPAETHTVPLWDMAEFFILRGHRGRGIGTAVAHKMWNQFPGRWQVRVMSYNVRALRFWDHAVITYTAESTHSQINERREQWHIFSFPSGKPAQTSPADETGK